MPHSIRALLLIFGIAFYASSSFAYGYAPASSSSVPENSREKLAGAEYYCMSRYMKLFGDRIFGRFLSSWGLENKNAIMDRYMRMCLNHASILNGPATKEEINVMREALVDIFNSGNLIQNQKDDVHLALREIEALGDGSFQYTEANPAETKTTN